MSRPQQHQNPDYYAETASLGPTPQNIQQHQQQQHQYQQPPPPPSAPQQQQQQQYYYPPPPSAPQQQQQQSQQYYYPPPPTAPQQQPSPAPPASSPGKPPGSSGGSGQPAAGHGSSSKPSFGERLHQWSVKAGVPINKLTNQLGSEAFWPSDMDKECDKAARILQSFCKNGFYATEQNQPPGGPKTKSKVLVKIPPRVFQEAAGLAVFTTFRTGLHISGAGGSGVVAARLPDGTWSPPSGFLVHTLGAGFMVGLDIYDCVCVLRTPDAVRAFTRPRVSLGGEVGLVAGPVGGGASVEAALGSSTKPAWAYMKSRGLYAGVQADGTVVVARNDANAAFYGQKGIRVEQILRGEVPARGPEGMWPGGARHLMEALKSAEGRRDVNEAVLREVDAGPTPGDLGVGERDKDVQLGSA